MHFVIFGIFSDFGEILKKLKIFDVDHILPNILVLPPNFNTPYNLEETWYDHEIAYLTMNYGPEDVVKISDPTTKQNPRSQGVVPPQLGSRVLLCCAG